MTKTRHTLGIMLYSNNEKVFWDFDNMFDVLKLRSLTKINY